MAHDIQEQVCIPCSPDVGLLVIEVCTLIPEYSHWNAPLEDYEPLQVVHHQFWFSFYRLCSLQSLTTGITSTKIENMLFRFNFLIAS